MKTSLLIVVLSAIINLVNVLNAQTLQYNLKEGDEWVVKVTNKNEWIKDFYSPRNWWLDSNEMQVYFKIIVEGREDSITNLKGEILRVIRNRTSYFYDTDYGFSPINEVDRECKSMIGKEFTFQLYKYGEVRNIFPILKDTINKERQEFDSYLEFYREKENKHQWEYFNTEFYQFLFQSAFPLTMSKELYVERRNNNQENTKAYGLVKSKGKGNTVNYLPIIECLKEYIPSNRSVKYEILDPDNDDKLKKHTLEFSREKGRIIKGKVNIGINDLGSSLDFTKYYSIEYIEEYIPPKLHDAVLTGKIENYNNEPIALYIWKKFPDAPHFKIDSVLSNVNKDGTFKLVMPIKRDFEVTFRVGEMDSEHKFQKQMFIEPGDSVCLHIKNKGSKKNISFSGQDSKKYMQFQYVDNLLDELSHRSFKTPELLVQSVDELTHIAEEHLKNDSLSVWAKKNYMAKVYFGAYRVGLDYISKHVVKPEEKTKWRDIVYNSVRPKQYPSYTSFEMRQFIGPYFKHQKDGLFNNNLVGDYFGEVDANYSFAKRIFNSEIHYYAMAEMLWQSIREGNIERSLEVFKIFKRDYPQTEMSNYFDKLLGNFSLLKGGNMAPDFQVEDENGDLFSLSDFNGKWVCLMFVSAHLEPNMSLIKSLGYYTKYIDDSRFKPLLILTDAEVSPELLQQIKKYYSGQIGYNPEWKYPSTNVYNVSYRTGTFLINPKGVMDSPWLRLPRELVGFQNERIFTKNTFLLKEYMDSKEVNTITVKSETLYFFIGLILVFIFVLILALLVWRYRVKRKAEEKREKLQLELKAIRSQLNPHFMFNSLNSIQNLVVEDKKDEASTYLSQFAGLMRQVLKNSEKELIPLEEELSAIYKYLQLEALRFNFDFNVFVDDQIDVFNIDVPGLFLQPFVENAVVHGVAGQEEKGKIKVSILKQGDSMICRVEDNGFGYYPDKKEANNGCGVSLSEKRFEIFRQAIKANIDFKITNKSDVNKNEKGTLVEIFYELDRD